MPIPPRAFVPPENIHDAIAARDFVFPEHVARDPDEIGPRDQCQEILAPVLGRLRQGDMPGALRAAERLCRQRPGNAFAVVEYARLLTAAGLHAQAAGLLESVLARNDLHLEALKLLGAARLKEGRAAEAMELFGRAVRRAPADSFAQINFQALRGRLPPRRASSLPATAARPTVATSLPPKNFETGQAAVRSWRERGMRVLSVNTAAERDLLAPHFPEVEFVVSEQTARKEFGKDYQYLDSLLDALAETGSPLCGIVNADIILRGGSDVWDQLCAAAGERFVYGSRVNVPDLGAGQGTMLEPGFDCFFFPAAFAPLVPRTGFALGQPAWDVFLPAWAARRGFPLTFCYSPVALHVEHPVQWSRTANSRFLLTAVSFIAPELAALLSGDPGCHAYLRQFTGALSSTLNRSAKGRARPFFCDSPDFTACLAPVDPLYWLRDSEETLVALRQG